VTSRLHSVGRRKAGARGREERGIKLVIAAMVSGREGEDHKGGGVHKDTK